jgi:hypothetical protein
MQPTEINLQMVILQNNDNKNHDPDLGLGTESILLCTKLTFITFPQNYTPYRKHMYTVISLTYITSSCEKLYVRTCFMRFKIGEACKQRG